jgi:hypothetical protein
MAKSVHNIYKYILNICTDDNNIGIDGSLGIKLNSWDNLSIF